MAPCSAVSEMEAEKLYEKTVPGFPDISKTNPNVRFLVPKAWAQSRR